MTEKREWFGIFPEDEHNLNLIKNTHPPEWENPVPEPIYNLVVIGAGTAGLISAIGCAALGGKVALVERNLMGGDCLNVGCVPSKSLLRSSRAAMAKAEAGKYGLSSETPSGEDFSFVMERLRRIRAQISRNDSAQRFADMGVDVFLGSASFTEPGTIRVGEDFLHYRKAIIAAGARAVHPQVPGLEEAGFLTNETVFNLTELPSRLAVIGGGPIGCELAQAFRRLGADVTIIQNSRFLPREDKEAADLLKQVLEREGINILLQASPVAVESENGVKKIRVETGEGEVVVEVDEILAGAGRQPNVEGLSLEEVGVEYDSRQGVKVDDFLRTSNADIYAAGDICMNWKFTHAAEAAARIAVQNALFLGRKRLSRLNMPWCTYTDPEISHVGLYEKEAGEQGIGVDIYRINLDEIDRAVTDGEAEGFLKVLVRKGSDKILGATIVAAHAGDLISEISVAMAGGIGLKTIADVIHPYPTQADAIRRVANLYNKKRLTPRIAALLKWWLKRQRGH